MDSVPDIDPASLEIQAAAVPQTSTTSSVSFSTTGQGMWGPGPEAVAQYVFRETLIDEGFNVDIREDGRVYEFNADVDAYFHLGIYGGARAEGGSVDVTYPTTATTEAVGYNGVAAGEEFVIRTSEVPGAATMTTDFAEVSAEVGVYGSVGAGIGAYAETFTQRLFDPFYTSTESSFSQEILGVSLADGSLDLDAFGQPVFSGEGIDLAEFLPDPFGDFVNLELNVPSLDTGPVEHSTFNGDFIQNTLLPIEREDADPTDIDIVKLGLDADAMIGYIASEGAWSSGATIEPVPGFIEAELFDLDFDSFWGIGQTLTFDPNLSAVLTFSAPTLVENFPGAGIFSRTLERVVPVGSDVRVVHPGGDLTIDVSYRLANSNRLYNDTDLIADFTMTPKLLNVDFDMPSAITDVIGDPDFCLWCPAPTVLANFKVLDITSHPFGEPSNWPLEGFVDESGGQLVLPAFDPPILSASVEIDSSRNAILSGRVFDPNAGETFTLDLYWDDPSVPANYQPLTFGTSPIDSGGVTWNPASGEFSVEHTYPSTNAVDTYEIVVTAIDSTQRSSATRRLGITFIDPAPRLDLIDFSRIDFNEPDNGSRILQLNGEINEDNGTDTFSLMIDWGDPNSPDNVETYEFGATAIDTGVVMWTPGPHFGSSGRLWQGGGYFEIHHEYLGDDWEDRFLVTGVVTDSFGQSASEQAVARFYEPNLPDVTAPTITIVTPEQQAVFEQNAVVIADYSCEDAQYESGIDTCIGTVAMGEPIDTSTAGVHTFTVTARDVFSRTTTTTHTYRVLGDPIRAIDDQGEGSVLTSGNYDVGSNDINVESGSLYYLTGEQTAEGSPSISPASAILSYTPTASETGFVNIGYQVCPIGFAAGDEACDDARLTINLGLGSAVTCNGLPVTIDMNNGGSGTGTSGDDVILGTPGNDTIDGLEGDDTICAGAGNDWVQGGAGNDNILGEAGDDKLFGAQGHDIINGGIGDDVLHGNRGNDRLGGDDGADRIFGYAHNDIITGGDGPDRLHGNFGDDIIDGGEGDDRIFGYGDADDLTGGLGDDLITGNFGDDVINGDEGNDILYGADGDDIVNGGPGNDEVNGNSLNDTLTGGQGNDTLDGGINTDTCSGGPGTDTATRCETTTGVP